MIAKRSLRRIGGRCEGRSSKWSRSSSNATGKMLTEPAYEWQKHRWFAADGGRRRAHRRSHRAFVTSSLITFVRPTLPPACGWQFDQSDQIPRNAAWLYGRPLSWRRLGAPERTILTDAGMPAMEFYRRR
jgi:hypothetical protein